MKHIITVHVENKPGVLARVSSMFARRGFNIHSLTVGPTVDDKMSRMTVVVDGPEMEQIVKQLRKMINTVKVTELAPGEGIEREVILVRVSAAPAQRGELLSAATIFGAKAADVGPSAITFEMADTPERCNHFLGIVAPYGIVELVKSGRIALRKDTRGEPRQTGQQQGLRAIGS